MVEIINERIDLCVGCNRCVRECPMEMANVTYLDDAGDIKVKINQEKCIDCGSCVSACKHDARYFVDDTERFFNDLSNGVPISLITAPSIKTNIPEYKRLFTYLRNLGVNIIYDVSLGADICIWAHISNIRKNGISPIITQPCPPIVTYCELYRHDLLNRLSSVHSPMVCSSIHMKEYLGISDRIAAISPCMAKTVEFNETKLVDYNITFVKLQKYLSENNVTLPDEETGFDHSESGPGSLFPMPGGFKENIEFFIGKSLHITKAEGLNVYEKLDKYAKVPDEFLPDIFDVLNCAEGCNIGTASLNDRCIFEMDKTMNNYATRIMEERKEARKKEHYESVFRKYDSMFDLALFTRKYHAVTTVLPQITQEDIDEAFLALGKTDYDKQHIDCYACGSVTCYDMARKIALRVNIPENCIVKTKDDARLEHEENLIAHAQLHDMEKAREMDEFVRVMFDSTPFAAHFWDENLVMTDCNEAAAKMFNITKQEYVSRYYDFMPTFQPNGMRSVDRLRQLVARAFETGYQRTELTCLSIDGDEIPLDDTYVCVDFKGKKIVAGYSVDLREQKKLIEEAENQRKAADSANKAKSDFLSHISHEIRTPMNAILGTAEIQLQEIDHPQEVEEAFDTIYGSGNLLLNIINDILDLSKIEAGKLEIMSYRYDIPSIIYDTVQLNLLRYESRSIAFDLMIDENTPLDLLGDELRIKQILNNILSNAFKYTDKGKVELSVSSETDVDMSDAVENSQKDCILVFQISDTGQGMTQYQIEELFDEYTRFNTDFNRTIVGTGLGMHITKRLVDAMDGEIHVESKLDVGSVFTVRLPQKRIGTQVCGADLAEQLCSSRFKSTMKMNRAQIVHELMPYGSVLVVDDVESNLYVARGMLLPYGLNIETVTNGFDAVKKVKDGAVYDIIFMDQMMPKMDGTEATQQIRELGYNHPVVAMTANAVTGSAEMFLANGFDGYISKPVDIRELNSLLNRMVRDKQPKEILEAVRSEVRQAKPVNQKKPSRSEMKQNSSETTSKPNKVALLGEEMAEAVLYDIEYAVRVLNGLLSKHGAIGLGDTDLKLYTTTVHGIKSALSNVDEKELSAIAFKLEQFGDDNNVDEILSRTPAFIESLMELIESLRI